LQNKEIEAMGNIKRDKLDVIENNPFAEEGHESFLEEKAIDPIA